jgi:Domain of unknown function (DUF4328)
VSTKQTLTAGVLDLTRRTKAACYLLWAFAGIAGLILASDLVRLQLLSDTTFNVIGEAVENNLAIHRVLGLLQGIAFISSGIAFLLWKYRANGNCRALGAKGMTSPGWTVGWYFVPFANLWKPYQPMEEIWQASENPYNWQRVKRPTIVTCWWLAWLADILAFYIAMTLKSGANTSDRLTTATVADMFLAAADILAALLAAAVIAKVHSMQETWLGSSELSNPTQFRQRA